MSNDESTPVPEEGEHIVANLAVMGMLGQVLVGEAHQSKLLGSINGLESLARGQALPRLHLHEGSNLASDCAIGVFSVGSSPTSTRPR